MKNLSILPALVFAFANAQAEPALMVAADSSNLSALCVAAASSDRPLLDTARSYGIARNEVNEIQCNGMALEEFAMKYKAGVSAAPRNLVFRKNDDSDLTELCLQAVSSFDQYQQTLHQQFAGDAKIGSELTCNGMPVIKFISRYRNTTAAKILSQQ